MKLNLTDLNTMPSGDETEPDWPQQNPSGDENEPDWPQHNAIWRWNWTWLTSTQCHLEMKLNLTDLNTMSSGGETEPDWPQHNALWRWNWTSLTHPRCGSRQVREGEQKRGKGCFTSSHTFAVTLEGSVWKIHREMGAVTNTAGKEIRRGWTRNERKEDAPTSPVLPLTGLVLPLTACATHPPIAAQQGCQNSVSFWKSPSQLPTSNQNMDYFYTVPNLPSGIH